MEATHPYPFKKPFLLPSLVGIVATWGLITHAYAAPASIYGLDHPDRIPDQYVVVLKSQEGTQKARDTEVEAKAAIAVQNLAVEKGFKIKHEFKKALKGFTVIGASEEQLQQLANDPEIAFIEADRIVRLDGIQSPISFPEWGLDRISQRTLPLDSSYHYNFTGANVHAYVLDTGLNATHGEFTGRVGTGATFITDGNGIYDCHGHGTHVSGTVGGTRFGVAKNVIIHPVRVLGCDGTGSWSGIISSIDWVINNRQMPAVINMSIGGGFFQSVTTAIDNAVAAGITVVVAAGNNSDDACSYSPAAATNAISVGATDQNDQRAFFSNTGSCVDIFAPGESITSAYIPGSTANTTMSGTSMAAPHVAGAAALYLEKNPTATPQQVANAITSQASKDLVLNPGTNSPNLLLFSNFESNSTPITWTRTIIFIEDQTKIGQEMFIRGGIDHNYALNKLGRNCNLDRSLCAIPIRHLNMRNATTTPWKVNDNLLDWHGAEPGQNTGAQGSPADWTTNLWPSSWGAKRTVAIDGYGETPLNIWGAHYWMLDVEMDCSKTVNGWFELKSYMPSTSGWEGTITQPGAPYASINHFAQCGKRNVFKRNQNNPVAITNL